MIPKFCTKCGAPNFPREHQWYLDNFARIVPKVRAGTATEDERALVDAAADLVATQIKLGTLCGSEAGAAAVKALAMAARKLMPPDLEIN